MKLIFVFNEFHISIDFVRVRWQNKHELMHTFGHRFSFEMIHLVNLLLLLKSFELLKKNQLLI